MDSIVINTERLTLKPLGRQYLETTNEYTLSYENTKYMEFWPNKSSDETLRYLKWVEAEWNKDEPMSYVFAVMYRDRHIGTVSLYNEGGSAELGWVLNKKYWGNGFAAEAGGAVIEYFSNNKGMTHFIAFCDTENVSSYRTLEKLGMTRTLEYKGRKNRSATQESSGYKYELYI